MKSLSIQTSMLVVTVVALGVSHFVTSKRLANARTQLEQINLRNGNPTCGSRKTTKLPNTVNDWSGRPISPSGFGIVHEAGLRTECLEYMKDGITVTAALVEGPLGRVRIHTPAHELAPVFFRNILVGPTHEWVGDASKGKVDFTSVEMERVEGDSTARARLLWAFHDGFEWAAPRYVKRYYSTLNGPLRKLYVVAPAGMSEVELESFVGALARLSESAEPIPGTAEPSHATEPAAGSIMESTHIAPAR